MTPRLLAAVLAAAALAGAVAGPASAAPRPPHISAPAAILVDGSTGERVYGRRPDQERAIASTTKLMTVYVALRRLPLTRTLTAPAYPVQASESQIGLRAGERMTVADLVRAVMLPSANDAANALAVRAGHGSKSAFVAAMNREARRLGLRHTHYATPVGLDTPGNYSTAADLARLAVAVRRVPFLRRTMDRPRAVLRSGDHPRAVVNRNTVVDDVPWANGVKTGHTNQAGYVLVGSGTRHGLTFISAVLGTSSEAARDADSLALLRWAFAHFHVTDVLREGAVVGRAAVRHDGDVHVPLVADRSVRRLVARGQLLRLQVAAPRELAGPLPRGAVVGRVTVRAGRRVLGTSDLVTSRRVPAVGLVTRGMRAVGGPATLVIIVAIGALALTMIRRRTVARRRRRSRRPGPETA